MVIDVRRVAFPLLRVDLNLQTESYLNGSNVLQGSNQESAEQADACFGYLS